MSATPTEVLHRYVQELLDATRSDWPYPPDLDATPFGSVLGMYVGARSILDDCLRVCVSGGGTMSVPVNCRAIFEDTVTLTWLLGDPGDEPGLEERFTRFAQDSNRTISLIAEGTGGEAEQRFVELQQQRWAEFRPPDVPFALKLPAFHQRLVEPMELWYPRYRRLTLLAHPTLPSVHRAIRRAMNTFPGPEDEPIDLHLAFGAMLVAHSAFVIDQWVGAPTVLLVDLEHLLALEAAINVFTQGPIDSSPTD